MDPIIAPPSICGSNDARGFSDDHLFDGTLRLRQRLHGHRAGSDAVLLAALTPGGGRSIADLGAGSGIVGLRAAQLEPAARVVLFEQDPVLVDLCRHNAHTNGLFERVDAQQADVTRLGTNPLWREAFDTVLTNPPFFTKGQMRASPDPARASAHHMPFTLDAWLRGAVGVLRPGGVLALIHRADALESLLPALSGRFGDIQLAFVHPDAHKGAIRVLVRAVKGSRAPLQVRPPLVLHDNGRFTAQAQALHAGTLRLDGL